MSTSQSGATPGGADDVRCDTTCSKQSTCAHTHTHLKDELQCDRVRYYLANMSKNGSHKSGRSVVQPLRRRHDHNEELAPKPHSPATEEPPITLASLLMAASPPDAPKRRVSAAKLVESGGWQCLGRCARSASTCINRRANKARRVAKALCEAQCEGVLPKQPPRSPGGGPAAMKPKIG